jgi:hypothetical protein
MPLLPLNIPPGIVRNGTDMQSMGRWRDASLVRWRNGVMQPIGGWRQRVETALTGTPRAAHAWRDNSADRWLAVGTHSRLYAINALGTATDITPTGLVVGDAGAMANTSFGGGFYGTSFYGVQRPDTGSKIPATTWALDSWGEYLVACSDADGRILEWQLNTANDAAVVANAPTSNGSMMVTEERFLFALAAGGNPRKVQWSDREANTVWTPAATNQAGDVELQTSGQIMCGVRTRGQALILTDQDAHTATYQGPPFVYGFERVGTSCGAISRRAAVAVDAGVFWMGQRGFFAYSGGGVQPLPSDVGDFVFGRLNRPQVSKVYAVANSQYGEIWWFYPAGVECDSYVIYNYVEGHWSIGSISRSCGVDRGTFSNPIYVSPAGIVYDHDFGNNYDGASVFAESGPISLGVGEQVLSAVELIPDEATQGDTTVTFKTRFHPNDTERAYGPYTLANPTPLRFTGRQIRMLVTGARLADWRVGVPRLDVRAGGRR